MYKRDKYIRLFVWQSTLLAILSLTPSVWGANYTPKQLSKLLRPIHEDTITTFSSFINTESIANYHKTPEPRSTRNRFPYQSDLAHKRGLKIQYERGLITKGTLILSDTGHDIPLAAKMLKLSKSPIQVIFHLPIDLLSQIGTDIRLLSQAQEWGREIHLSQIDHAKKGAPKKLFIGLEGHRKDYDQSFLYTIPWEHFPSHQDLIEFGIDQIIYMTESHPDDQDSALRRMREDVAYFLKNQPLPFKVIGVDCRRRPKC